MSLRKKLADSPWLARRVAGLFAGWVRLAHRSSRWQRIGFEDMERLVESGEPVIVALWHQRLMMSPYLFDTSKGPICSLTSAARAGRMAGLIQTRFGFGPIAMSSHKRHVALSREVLGQIRQGVSIGIATDGPRGPARVASTVPLIWARASGKRVFLVCYSARRVHELPTWDRMWLPAFFTRGVLMCREWPRQVPRQASPEEIETLRQDLQAALNALSDECDRRAGRRPRP